MKNMSLLEISVIIPVFNTETYLPRCIDSILSQTFTNFEILLINDGSTDSSGMICDSYQRKDERISVFHIKNSGVSSARNVGLAHAKGRWVSFIDADDYISPDFFSDILKFCDADVLQKSYCIQSETVDIENLIERGEEMVVSEDIEKFFVRSRTNALWNKLIKRSLIGDTKFLPNIQVGEDFLFFLSILPFITKYCFSTIGIYYYQMHSNSLMDRNSCHVERLNIVFRNIENILRITSSRHLFYLQQGVIYHTYLNFIFSNAMYLSNEQVNMTNQLIRRLSYSSLRYLSFKQKVKLYMGVVEWKFQHLLKCLHKF